MRRLTAMALGPLVALVLAVQPVVAANWNEAVGWVDLYRGPTLLASFWGTSACTDTTCTVNVPMSRTYLRQLSRWGCTSDTIPLRAGTTYSQDVWRTLGGQCNDPVRPNFSARFSVRLDVLDQTGTTQWITLDEAATVTVNVVSR